MKLFYDLLMYLAILGVIILILLLPIKVTIDAEEVKYCYVDSIMPVHQFYVIQDTTFKYHTSCGHVFFNKKKYHIGDSIKIKTIVIRH